VLAGKMAGWPLEALVVSIACSGGHMHNACSRMGSATVWHVTAEKSQRADPPAPSGWRDRSCKNAAVSVLLVASLCLCNLACWFCSPLLCFHPVAGTAWIQ